MPFIYGNYTLDFTGSLLCIFSSMKGLNKLLVNDSLLFEGDCIDLLANIPPASVDLVITSPPYNVGKQYEKSVPLDEYLSAQESVIEVLLGALAPTGSICWQIGNYVYKGRYIRKLWMRD